VAVRDFEQLEVWQAAHRLVLEIYRATETFPAAEIYGLTSQMRRSASSITANTAEGCGRGGHVELARFLQIARGSASELQSHLRLAKDLNHLSQQNYGRLLEALTEVEKMLVGYRQFLLRESERKTPRPD
jgi:four helix bundle protein